MKKYRIVFVLLIVLFFTYFVDAQCPMCKLSVESNLKNGGSSGKGLNAGIIYMLLTPYLVVSTIAYMWWKNRKKNYDNDAEPAKIDFSDN